MNQPRAIVAAFPVPGRRVEHAYRELEIAQFGTDEQRKALGTPKLLARPWDPPSCVDPGLREEVWSWLEEVVVWLNAEYVWDVATMIPACWPLHPHLVHEVAVLADLRRRAGQALNGDAMEEWHRYALPTFVDRMRGRMRGHCEDKEHQPWPAQGRQVRHTSIASAQERGRLYAADLATSVTPDLGAFDLPSVPPPAPPPTPPAPPSTGRHLHVVDGRRVDPITGEVVDE